MRPSPKQIAKYKAMIEKAEADYQAALTAVGDCIIEEVLRPFCIAKDINLICGMGTWSVGNRHEDDPLDIIHDKILAIEEGERDQSELPALESERDDHEAIAKMMDDDLLLPEGHAICEHMGDVITNNKAFITQMSEQERKAAGL